MELDAAAIAVVFVAALATALTTSLGALPFAFSRNAALWLGPANAAAAGVMLAASASLLIKAASSSTGRMAAGAVGGALFVYLARRILDRWSSLAFGALRGADARKGLLIMFVMTVHSAAEGIGVGAAFGGGESFGLLVVVAIAIHNIPEGLAICLVLIPRGTRTATAAGWSFVSSLPQPLLAIPAFVFVAQASGLLPVGLGFAAGAMIWMAVAQLVPEAMDQTSVVAVATATVASFAAMLAFQLLWL